MSDLMDARTEQVVGIIQNDVKNLTPEQKVILAKAQKKRNEWVAAYPEIGKNTTLASMLAYGLYRFNGQVEGMMEEIYTTNNEIDALLNINQSPEDKMNLLQLRLTNSILNAEKGKVVYILGKGNKGTNKTWNKGTEKESTGHTQFTLTVWLDDKKSIESLFIADDAVPPYEQLEIGNAYKIQMSEGKEGRLFPDKNPLAKPIPGYVLNQKEVLQSVLEGTTIPPLDEPYAGAVLSKKNYYVVGTVSKDPQSGWDIIPRKATSSQLVMIGSAGAKVGEGDVCLIVGRVVESTTKEGQRIENSYTLFPEVVIPVKKSKVEEAPSLPPGSTPVPSTPSPAVPPVEVPQQTKSAVDNALGI